MVKKKEEKKKVIKEEVSKEEPVPEVEPKEKELEIYKVVFSSEGKKYESKSGSVIEPDEAEQVEGNTFKLKDGSIIKLVTQF
jgi:uncharacterized cupredoxin-like copper-binding protein